MSDRWSTRSPGARQRPSSGKSLRVRRGPPARAAGPSRALGAPSTPPARAGGRTGSGLGSSVCSDFAVCGPARPPSVSPRVREASGLWVQEKGEGTGRQDGRTARLRPLGRCPGRIGVPPRARPSSFPGKGLRFPDALRGRKSSRNSTALDEGHGARKRPRSILHGAVPGVPGGARGWAGPAPSRSRGRGGLGPGSADRAVRHRPQEKEQGRGGRERTQLRWPRSPMSPVPARASEDGPGAAVAPASSPTGRPRGFAVAADQAARTGRSAHGGSCVRRGGCGCPEQTVGLAPLGDTQSGVSVPRAATGPQQRRLFVSSPRRCVDAASRTLHALGTTPGAAARGCVRARIMRALHARARCACSTCVHTCVSARARLRVRVGVVRARAARLCVRRVCAGGALAAPQLLDSHGPRLPLTQPRGPLGRPRVATSGK